MTDGEFMWLMVGWAGGTIVSLGIAWLRIPFLTKKIVKDLEEAGLLKGDSDDGA